MNEEDPIENEGAGVLTRFIFPFFRRQGQLTQVRSGILPKFKLIQAFMAVRFTCKNEENPSKNEGSRVLTRFFPL